MDEPKTKDLKELEAALQERRKTYYVLRLYVSGFTAKSQRAIENLKTICEEYLKDRYELEIVDIFQQPALARTEQIIAAPTLIKKLPPPVRKLIGDLSQTKKILVILEQKPLENSQR